MELTRDDTRSLKGIAIILMVLLHLFARKEIEGFYASLYLINGTPIEYYIGLFGDACRPLYLFVTGYAFYLVFQKRNTKQNVKNNLIRVLKLLINFWIMLLLFTLIGFATGNGEVFGSSIDYLKNFFLIEYSYNGAWWFLRVYIIIVLLSPLLIMMIRKNKLQYLLPISGLVYFVSYIQFYKGVLDLSFLGQLEWLILLSGTSQFSFVIGGVFSKYKVISFLRIKTEDLKLKNLLCIAFIFGLVAFHGFVIESAIIAPMNAMLFICCFSIMNFNKATKKILNYLSGHSTNIWLTHMFLYISFFADIIFFSGNSIITFFTLIAMCIAVSHIIKLMNDPLIRLVDKSIKHRRMRLNEENLKVG